MRIWVVLSVLLFFANLNAREVHVDEIIDIVVKAKNAIVQENLDHGLHEENLVFLSVWNFDNTILHGDSTEGLLDGEGRVVFKGLAQVAIEAGLSQKYPAKGGFSRFWSDYQTMEQKDEPKAYAYCAQMLAGAKESDVLKLSTDYFMSTLQNHFFEASKELVRSLHNLNIQTWVVSASPRLFVQGAGRLLNIPLKQIYGMETAVKNGVLTDQMVLPLTTRQGKVEKINQIVRGILAADSEIKKVYVLGGFGNNNANDIVFLKWIAAQRLPAGEPLSVVGFQAPLLPKNFVSVQLVSE